MLKPHKRTNINKNLRRVCVFPTASLLAFRSSIFSAIKLHGTHPSGTNCSKPSHSAHWRGNAILPFPVVVSHPDSTNTSYILSGPGHEHLSDWFLSSGSGFQPQGLLSLLSKKSIGPFRLLGYSTTHPVEMAFQKDLRHPNMFVYLYWEKQLLCLVACTLIIYLKADRNSVRWHSYKLRLCEIGRDGSENFPRFTETKTLHLS
jgi:hypothetical protein